MKKLSTLFLLVIFNINLALAQFEEFRQAWAENDGSEWYAENFKEGILMSLVSKNSADFDKMNYAKVLVVPFQGVVIVAVQGLDLTKTFRVSFDNGTKKIMFYLKSGDETNQIYFSSMYDDFSISDAPIMQKIGLKATVFVFNLIALSHIYKENNFSFNIEGSNAITFNFSTNKTLQDLLKE